MQMREIIAGKIYGDVESLKRMISVWRFKSNKVVFTNGCFDILHLGHIDYLMKAADLGDMLIIGMNSDASVKQLKGSHRPINDENARKTIMASLHFVDAVILFDEDTPYNLIKEIRPDVLVKGADYKPEEIAGYDILKSTGGEVVTLELLPGYSTTLIEEKIKKGS